MKPGIRWTKRGHHAPAVRRSDDGGVRNSRCSAGKRVNDVNQHTTIPAATQYPISRIGRIPETPSAANPTAAAKIDAVQGRNLLQSMKT